MKQVNDSHRVPVMLGSERLLARTMESETARCTIVKAVAGEGKVHNRGRMDNLRDRSD